MINRSFTDVFIRKPIVSVVVSLIILLLGLRAFTALKVRQYPDMRNTMIEVTTVYPGAPASLIQGFVTSVLERSIAGSEGIDYMSSTSSQGVSDIKVYIKVGADGNKSYTDVMSSTFSQLSMLPTESQLPVVKKHTGSPYALLYVAFMSDHLSMGQISDYLQRTVKPKFFTVDGVGQVNILGASDYAMRIWIDNKKLAAHNLSMSDVSNAIAANNIQSAPGQMKGQYVKMDVRTNTDINTTEQFANIVVKQTSAGPIRIRDVAQVKVGVESYSGSVKVQGKPAVFLGVYASPDANSLDVGAGIRALLPSIQKASPADLNSTVMYDGTVFVSQSINEVVHTLIEAVLIVVAVMFLFLGSFRIVIIPVVTIPLSLIGSFFIMLLFGYSINLLTLLAMVLAVGLVVDDAIVVVENIYRYIEEGMSVFDASIRGARDIATPVISMTITLVAVYVPIGFMGGVTGSLFREFAFTLAGSVFVSGVVALTLSTAMSSQLLSRELLDAKAVKLIDAVFEKTKSAYEKLLRGVFNFRPQVLLFSVALILGCLYMFYHSSSELAPTEDQGIFIISGSAPFTANRDYDEAFLRELDPILDSYPEKSKYFSVAGMGGDNSSTFSMMMLKDWAQRKRSVSDVTNTLYGKLDKIAGLRLMPIQMPALPIGSGWDIELQLVSQEDYRTMYKHVQEFIARARATGQFAMVFNKMNFNKPQLDIKIDREEAQAMGVSMREIATSLAYAMGGNYVSRFNLQDMSYKVIPMVQRFDRLSADAISSLYIKPQATDLPVRLSTFVRTHVVVEPSIRARFQQQNAISIDIAMMPGLSSGDGLKTLQNIANDVLPKTISLDYSGGTRTYVQEGSSLVVSFFLALLVIFLVLAVQFNSFRDPAIILYAVPLSVFGAMIPVYLGFATINIYTQIGLVTLIGLISKHGILIVEFAKQLQREQGLCLVESIIKASATRFRPVLMTTLAMAIAMVPLLFASGPGAVSRFDIGIVVFMGMMIGTVFTLFVLPVIYTFIAKPEQELPCIDHLD